MVLKIKNLNKLYKNGSYALQDINLKIESGEKVALLGLNGAGKSTLVGILSGYIIKNSGSIKINGYDIEKNRIEATKSMGVVHQEIICDTFFTVRETLQLQSGYYGIENNDHEIDEILEALELNNKSNTNTRFLSGGMKRRLMIAKALITKPKFLILDEPTVGIDVTQRMNMWRYLDNINKKYNIAILLTTHYMYEAELLCDKIIVIHGGKIITEGEKREIIKQYRIKHIALELNYQCDVQEIEQKQQLIANDLKSRNFSNFSFVFNYLNIYLDDKNFEQNFEIIKFIVEKDDIRIQDIKISDADLEMAFQKIIKETV